jgi:tetratricopeptide (TPR) repeat protein
LFLKGLFYWNKSSTKDRQKAIGYYQQAMALDSTYALAYAELANSYNWLSAVGVLDPKEFMPQAEAAALKAVELDDGLAEAHHALAGVKISTWDWPAVERESKRALELNPNLARAYRRYGFYLTLRERYEEAIAETRHSIELDPLSLGMRWGLGFNLLLARQNDQAAEVARKIIEVDQSYGDAYALLGSAYEAKGQYAEAMAAYQQAVKLGLQTPDLQIYIGTTYAKAGERGKAQAILKRLEAEKTVSRGALAELYAALGEREQAFAALEQAYAAHDPQLQFLRITPHLDPLRSDPRFQDLLRRVGLAQ